MTDEPRRRSPVGNFDASAKAAFISAQGDAERRGGKVLVSGLVMYAAAKAGNDFAERLLGALGIDLASLTEAVDDEWGARSVWMQDQPFTLVREAIEAVAADAAPGEELHLLSLLSKFLGYPDSMASRVALRIGVEPRALANRLTEV